MCWGHHIYPDFFFPAKLEVMDLLSGGQICILVSQPYSGHKLQGGWA